MIRIKKGGGATHLMGGVFLVSMFVLYMSTDMGCRVRAALSSFVYPLFQVQQFFVAPITSWANQRNDRIALQEQVQQLQQEKEDLQAQVIKLTAQHNFYQQIREVVAFTEQYETEGAILAQILMRSLTDARQQITVSAGSFHGVTRDMVAVYKNCLIGGVETVYPYYSTIKLITDPTCKVAAYCSATQASGIHEGCNKAGATKLEYVSHLNTIQDGDLVLSSGEGTRFPQGFGLGRVRAHKPCGLYHEIEVEPLMSVTDISYCMLIAKK